MNTEWKIFGRKSKFAFEYRFRDNPKYAPETSVVRNQVLVSDTEETVDTWGSFRFWVRGNNICQFSHNDDTVIDEITCDLDPLVKWLHSGLTGDSAFSSDSTEMLSYFIYLNKMWFSMYAPSYMDRLKAMEYWFSKVSLKQRDSVPYPLLLICTVNNVVEVHVSKGWSFNHISPEVNFTTIEKIFRFSRKEDVLAPLTRAVSDMVKHYKPMV